MLDSNKTLVGKMALAFAQALVDRDFEAARMLLSGSLREEWPARRLEEELTEMVAYGEGPPDQAEVINIDDMRECGSGRRGRIQILAGLMSRSVEMASMRRFR
jgi:hypothetical protein